MLRCSFALRCLVDLPKYHSIVCRGLAYKLYSYDTLYNDEIDNLLESQRSLNKLKSLDTRILTIGMCGAPNSGKSTLMNRIIGRKLSAVSHKVNTTRTSILGVKNMDKTQLVFYDTPGILQKRYSFVDSMICSGSSREEKELTGIARGVLDKTNVYLTLIDASIPLTYLSREVIHTSIALSSVHNASVLFVLNKVDLVKSNTVLQERKEGLLNEIPSKMRTCTHILEISALTGHGITSLTTQLLNFAKPGSWLYSSGVVTDRSPEEQACEVTREKVFHYLNQVQTVSLLNLKEIPYEMIFEHLGWSKENNRLVLHQRLLVQSVSKQRIVNKLKRRIEAAATADLQELFQRPLSLDLSVVVEKK